jgi:hypothetical protein
VVFSTATPSPVRGRCPMPLGLTHSGQLLHILLAEEAGTPDRRGRWGKLTFICQLADAGRYDAENAGRIRHSE